ncbi:uncharacterized protein LOC112087594 [Eutrema salsugineum]|uniref:uncharacterized protein LOC112087594 n=1 Tax=Eutrema salsugineum TaxID=72664 RepID=UPI000CED4A27|nr:uncharacterized protein LOC112087594 [Eutrema salsugineum]
MDTFYKGETSEPQKEDVVSEDAEDGEDVGNNVHEDFGMYDDIEVATVVEEDVYVNHTWEDGIDLAVGQEFGKRSHCKSKLKTPAPQELIVLVQNASIILHCMERKRAASNDVRGSPEESYQLLHSYLYMLEYMNPGTRTYVEMDEGNRFKYLLFALGACFEGFQVMRKVIALDATHLKNAYGGVLIGATAQDPDHHHYPIAFGVLDGEKEASWMWFMNMLRSVVPDVPELVFLSDRNQSLLKSIREVFPLSQHGVCIYHLSENVKGNVSGVNRVTCAKKFRACAHAYTENEFLTLYSAFRRTYPDAAKYLDRTVGEEKWARCYFPGDRYKIDTTNCAESINGVFVEAKKYSLLPMIDVIVAKLAEWFNKYRKASNEVSTAHKRVPYMENEMHVRCVEANLLTVH